MVVSGNLHRIFVKIAIFIVSSVPTVSRSTRLRRRASGRCRGRGSQREAGSYVIRVRTAHGRYGNRSMTTSSPTSPRAGLAVIREHDQEHQIQTEPVTLGYDRTTPKSQRIPTRFRSFSTPDELSNTSDEVSPTGLDLSMTNHSISTTSHDLSPIIHDDVTRRNMQCVSSSENDNTLNQSFPRTAASRNVKFKFPKAFSFRNSDGTNVTWKLNRRRSVDLSYTQCGVDHADRLVSEETRHVIYLDEASAPSDADDITSSKTNTPFNTYRSGYMSINHNLQQTIPDYMHIGHNQSTLWLLDYHHVALIISNIVINCIYLKLYFYCLLDLINLELLKPTMQDSYLNNTWRS